MNAAPTTMTWPKCVCNLQPKPTLYECATLSKSIKMAQLEKEERLANANKLAEEVTLVVHNENKTHQEKCDTNILLKLVLVWDCLFHQ